MRAARPGEAGGGVAPLPPLLLPLLGDPVDMAEILAVRRVTLSSSSSIGGPEEEAPGRGIGGGGGGGLIFFPFFFRNRCFSRPLSLSFLSSSRGSLHAFFSGSRERKSRRGFEDEHTEQVTRREGAECKQEKGCERERKNSSGRNQDRGARAKKKKWKKKKKRKNSLFFLKGAAAPDGVGFRLYFCFTDHDVASVSYCSRSYIDVPTFSCSSVPREEETR